MKNSIKFLFVGAFALLALVSCSSDEHSDSYYAATTQLSSSDPSVYVYDGIAFVDFGVGGGTATVNVSCGTDWVIENQNPELISATSTTTSVTVSVGRNDTDEDQDGHIILRTAKDGLSIGRIFVRQGGRADITLSSETLNFRSIGGTASVTVSCNHYWEFSYDSSNGWFTVEKTSTGLTVTAEANDSIEERSDVVNLTSTDDEGTVYEAQLTVVQTGMAGEDMVLTYTITTPNTAIQLPLYGTVICYVNWGDGSETEYVTSLQPSHTYAAAGEYDVVISGTVTKLYSNNLYSDSDPNLTLTAVKSWGKTGLTDMRYAFYCHQNLATLPGEVEDAFAKVETFFYAFDYCYSLKEIPAGMFDNCPEVTDFTFAFGYCTSLTEVPAGLFDNCPKVTTFYQLFRDCTSLTEVPAGLFDNCPLVTDMGYIFYECTSLRSIPSRLFYYNTEVTSFYCTFLKCYEIKEIPTGLFSTCTKVTNFQAVFQNCEGLTSVPSGIFDNCTEVENFQNVFNGCTGLTSVPSDIFSKNLKATNFTNSFKNDAALTGESPYDVIDGMKVHLYERASYPAVYAEPTKYGTCFTGCEGLDDYDSIPDDWK